MQAMRQSADWRIGGRELLAFAAISERFLQSGVADP
jgi:hypothetical protein